MTESDDLLNIRPSRRLLAELDNNAENVTECPKMTHFSSFFAAALTLSGLLPTAP